MTREDDLTSVVNVRSFGLFLVGFPTKKDEETKQNTFFPLKMTKTKKFICFFLLGKLTK